MARNADYSIRRLNCIDLDETIGRANFALGAFNSVRPGEHLTDVLRGMLEYYWEYPEELVKRAINDTETGLLGKIILKSFERGDVWALVTFNTSEVYTKFMLALLGLHPDEIEDFYIRNRNRTDSTDNKNLFISQVQEWASNDYPNTTWWVSLLDDREENCIAARALTYQAIQASEISKDDDSIPLYLKEYMSVLGLSEVDLESVELEPMDARMQTAYNILFEYRLAKEEDEHAGVLDDSELRRLANSFEQESSGLGVSSSTSTYVPSNAVRDSVSLELDELVAGLTRRRSIVVLQEEQRVDEEISR
jgi:hypothetical protein